MTKRAWVAQPSLGFDPEPEEHDAFCGAAPLFADERHELPFLDCLRLAFRWARFPGLDRHVERRDVQDFTARFGEGLLPF